MLTHNQPVAGSSPAGPTTHKHASKQYNKEYIMKAYVKVKYSSIKFPQKGSMRILVRGTWYKVPPKELHPAEYEEMLRLRRMKLPAGEAEMKFSSWGMSITVSTGWQQLQGLPYREVIFE